MVAQATAASEQHGLVITARSENYLYGREDLDDTIARLKAFEAAGAHCVYAPGIESEVDIELVLSEITKPLNVLLTTGTPSLERLRELGVRRASTGGALHLTAMAAARARAESLYT